MPERDHDHSQAGRTTYRPGLAIGAGLVIGAGLGISFGSIYGDVAMGLVYGAGLGLVLGAIIDGFIRWSAKRGRSDTPE